MAAPAADSADPLSRVTQSLKLEKYVPSKEEVEAISRCRNRMRANSLEAVGLGGALVWSVTGRLHLLPRLSSTCVGGYIAGTLAFKWSWKFCSEEILALDESYMQKRLVAILQKEAVHRPGIRALLEKYYYVEPLYDDSGHTIPGFSLRKREITREPQFSKNKTSSNQRDVVDLTSPKQIGDVPMTDLGGHESNPAANFNVRGHESNPVGNTTVGGHVSNQDFMQDNAYGAGLEGLLWNEGEESSKAAADGKSNRRPRDRMGVLERREYNRARYLEWQEKRKASGQDKGQAEL